MPLPTRLPTRSLAAGLATLLAGTVSSAALAQATIGPDLQDTLATLGGAESVQVVVTFDGSDPLDAGDVAALEGVGVSGLTMQALPMAGVIATKAQVAEIAALPDVRSVYLNAPMTYFNEEARALTGVDRMERDGNLRTAQGLPYSGKGVGVLINDSGIDATHPDVALGSKTVQNVLAQTNLNAVSGLLPVTWTENVPDTDIGSGHGTHVAATAAGTGAASGGAHAGTARGADLIGYGSGGVVLVLDGLGGFDYALVNQFRYNIRVINNSFGGSGTKDAFDPDNPYSVASKILADRGIVTVFAAGNSGAGEGTIGGTYIKSPWVVAVGAGNKDGTLADFSSRGVPNAGGTATVDGETFAWVDRPTVVAPGTEITSAFANTGVIAAPPDDADYATIQGTSMAAPHVAGVIALMFEANPQLHWTEVKDILERTATNMPGREPWEVGAGYLNAYAAVTMAAGLREEYGSTVALTRQFAANVEETRIEGPDLTVDYVPVGEPATKSFTVAPGLSTVLASAVVTDNTVAIVLRDPAGNRYGSGISLPVLGENIAVTAPAMAGEWTVELSGIGSISGVPTNPGGVTNGTALPGSVDVDIEFNRVDGYTGIADVAGHPARGIVERAVAERLVDARSNGFAPNAAITRAEMADYLTLGGAVRQHRDTDGGFAFRDVRSDQSGAAEAVTARGAAMRDFDQYDGGVMLANGDRFDPRGTVDRAELAYALVQALGFEDEAMARADELGDGPITAPYRNERVAISDDADVPAAFRGHVQLALDLRLIGARFGVEQGAFDLEPTVTASFAPDATVTRADYAFGAVNLFDRYAQGAVVGE